jgi:CRISPR/Cas system-associated exonuclease Cas4 (RecB family)
VTRPEGGPGVPQQGFHCIVDFVDVSFEDCVTCAATRGRCQFTASLLRGMADQAGQRDDRAISVSDLVGCVRQSYLKAALPYHQRPDYQYWAYRGTIGHTMASAGAGEETISERRFERELALPSGRRLTITGQPDEIVPARRLLVEYKTADRPPRVLSPQHIAQLNCYRWLIAPAYPIDTLGIVYLSMREVKKAPVPIWPDGQVERFLIEGAASLLQAREGGEWPAMTEDTWMCRYCPVADACARGPGDLSTTPAPVLREADAQEAVAAARQDPVGTRAQALGEVT